MRAVVRREEPDQNDPKFRQAVINAERARRYAEYKEWRQERRNLLIMKVALGIAVVAGIVILLYV